MPSDFFRDIDIDLNHFNQILPNISLENNNQYYVDVRFNNDFCVNGERDLSILHLNIRSISRNGTV